MAGFSVVFTQAGQPMPRDTEKFYATRNTGKVFRSLWKVPFNVQGLGIITPTHSLSPGIRAFCEYRDRGEFWTDTPGQLQERGGGERKNGFASLQWTTILDEQIVRIIRKRLIWSDRCQVWQIRGGQMGILLGILPRILSVLTDQTLDRWTCQLPKFFWASHWQIWQISDVCQFFLTALMDLSGLRVFPGFRLTGFKILTAVIDLMRLLMLCKII